MVTGSQFTSKVPLSAMLDFEYQVKRTNRRRSATIKVDDDAVVVVIPKTLSDAQLAELLRAKAPWVRKKLREIALLPKVAPKEYVSGEAFAYLGEEYRLQCCEMDSSRVPKGVQLLDDQLVLHVDPGASEDKRRAYIKASLLRWYREQALECLADKTEQYAQVIGVRPNSVKVKSYKSRWGACSATGDITYNWRLIMAPHRVVDYVVVHELCHMVHLNHSRAYWATVEKFYPDYKECSAWLKTHGRTLAEP